MPHGDRSLGAPPPPADRFARGCRGGDPGGSRGGSEPAPPLLDTYGNNYGIWSVRRIPLKALCSKGFTASCDVLLWQDKKRKPRIERGFLVLVQDGNPGLAVCNVELQCPR